MTKEVRNAILGFVVFALVMTGAGYILCPEIGGLGAGLYRESVGQPQIAQKAGNAGNPPDRIEKPSSVAVEPVAAQETTVKTPGEQTGESPEIAQHEATVTEDKQTKPEKEEPTLAVAKPDAEVSGPAGVPEELPPPGTDQEAKAEARLPVGTEPSGGMKTDVKSDNAEPVHDTPTEATKPVADMPVEATTEQPVAKASEQKAVPDRTPPENVEAGQDPDTPIVAQKEDPHVETSEPKGITETTKPETDDPQKTETPPEIEKKDAPVLPETIKEFKETVGEKVLDAAKSPEEIEIIKKSLGSGEKADLGGGKIAYRVKSGDTFSQVCKKVIGTSTTWRKQAEKMGIDYRKIKPGDVLVFEVTEN